MKEYELLNLETAEKLGYASQSNQLIEECAELIQAINKHKRAIGFGQATTLKASEAVDHIIEEIADVELMIKQIEHLLSINPKYVEGIKQYKVLRTRKRICGELIG